MWRATKPLINTEWPLSDGFESGYTKGGKRM